MAEIQRYAWQNCPQRLGGVGWFGSQIPLAQLSLWRRDSEDLQQLSFASRVQFFSVEDHADLPPWCFFLGVDECELYKKQEASNANVPFKRMGSRCHHIQFSSLIFCDVFWGVLAKKGCFFNVSVFPISSNSQRSLALNLQPSWSRSTRPTWRVSYGHHHALTNFPRPWRWMKPFEKSLRFSVSWSKGLVFFVVARKGSWKYFHISRRCMRESLKRWLFWVERLQKSHLSKKLWFSCGWFFFYVGVQPHLWIKCGARTSLKITMDSTIRNYSILLMEEIVHHLGCIKPCKSWDKLPQLDSRISSINRINGFNGRISWLDWVFGLPVTFQLSVCRIFSTHFFIWQVPTRYVT